MYTHTLNYNTRLMSLVNKYLGVLIMKYVSGASLSCIHLQYYKKVAYVQYIEEQFGCRLAGYNLFPVV